jgi:leucyl-tRNA synthetase
MDRYQPQDIEPRWQAVWQQTRLHSPDLATANRPFYNLMMFPYPSAEGLHVGNMYAFTGADIYGRFMAMRGFDVFQPIGFDAFGIHSENFAIARGVHPRVLTASTVERFRTQLVAIGNRFDWSRAVKTTDPGYYRWTQWLFLQLFKAGLAVRKKAPVNWCPRDRTVLADEQVLDGRCERCQSEVVQRELEQWFLRITVYADRLLDNLPRLDWSDKVKAAQRRWIGRSEDPTTGQPTYHLRDWLISRQRYWGTPIPIVHCPTCGPVPVPEDQLPVCLPPMDDWRPSVTGSSPLAEVPEFVNTTCPACGQAARRDTDVADNFLDSAWYYLRYPSSDCTDRAFDPDLTAKWLPVSMYVGGAEHAVLHLLYSRFISMALHDLGLIDFEEPFTSFRAHGLLVMRGSKMSKSRGNVVNPDAYIQRYGADTLRLYLMFLGPFDQGGEFSDSGIGGMHRFVHRVWRQVLEARSRPASDPETHALGRTIARVGSDLAALRYNTAIAALMTFVNQPREEGLTREAALVLIRLLAPFVPHLAEELWARLGRPYSVHHQPFPEADPRLLTADRARVAVQVNGRTRAVVELEPDASEAEAIAAARALRSMDSTLSAVKRTIYVPGRVLNLVLDV